MAIQKQEFYEGAALHGLARSGKINSIRYTPPFFIVNESNSILIKYSTRVRSPWGFTFTQKEQAAVSAQALEFSVYVGLVCAADGIVALDFDSFKVVVPMRLFSLRVACFRNHGEKYEVKGVDGALPRKVSPSAWQNILE